MYKFSLVQSVAGNATEPTRESFDAVIDSQRVAETCRRISEAAIGLHSPDEELRKQAEGKVSDLKHLLPAFCWHAYYDNGRRKNFCAHESGLVMVDVDHIESPEQTFNAIKEKAIALNLVAAHITPSTFGLRLVFVKPSNMTIEQTQKWLAHELQLDNVDGCVKDLARLSFIVPRSYWLHIDYDALFGDKVPTPVQTEHAPSLPNIHPSETTHAPSLPNPHPQPPVETERAPSNTPPQKISRSDRPGTPNEFLPSDFNGVPYSKIVEALEYAQGGRPAHGARNSQIFAMACALRHICNDDEQWIAQILPTYGEAEDRWRATIHSACQRPLQQQMPRILSRSIEMARQSLNVAKEITPTPVNILSADTPPEMPQKLPKLIKHLIKNVPEVCRPTVANAVFPSLAAHLYNVWFKLIDGTKKEATFMCVTMAKQSSGKAAINIPIEYICEDIVKRDELNRQREQEWKDAVALKSANKEKPKRPTDLCVQVLVSDMTNAAFVQRMKDANGRYLYTNLEELELLRQLQTNGSKDIGKIICLCFDNGLYGQERVGTQSVTARINLRWNWNASSTIQKGIAFFRNRLLDGTLSRINFTTIIKDPTKPFVYGDYDEKYAEELKPFISNLNFAKGEIVCPQALKMARNLQRRCEEMCAMADDEIMEDFIYRAVTIAYQKAMVLYIAHDMTWSTSIEEFCEWSLFYDLWCKNHFFGSVIVDANAAENVRLRPGQSSLLDSLPDRFTTEMVEELRRSRGMPPDPRHMLSVWISRGFVIKNDDLNLYEKTEKYKNKEQINH